MCTLGGGLAGSPSSPGMKIFNLNSDPEDHIEEVRAGAARGAGAGGRRIGSELIGGSMYEVEPGDKLWPFHTHHANEEWVIVLRGEPTLRARRGEQVLREGDVSPFPRQRGRAPDPQRHGRADPRAHASTTIAPDIVEYLDTGKVGARSVAGDGSVHARGPSSSTWEGRGLGGQQHAREEEGIFLVTLDTGVALGLPA